jgi:hypothetical protein
MLCCESSTVGLGSGTTDTSSKIIGFRLVGKVLLGAALLLTVLHLWRNDPWTNQGRDSEKSDLVFLMSNHTATTPEPPSSETSPLSLVGNNMCLEMGEWYRQMKNLNANRSSQTRPLPIWMVAYPGSGSELMRDLVNELTQNVKAGGDIYSKTKCLGAVTCKTHFPALPFKPPTENKRVSTQVVAQSMLGNSKLFQLFVSSHAIGVAALTVSKPEL